MRVFGIRRVLPSLHALLNRMEISRLMKSGFSLERVSFYIKKKSAGDGIYAGVFTS
jgi:hypothetical protein